MGQEKLVGLMEVQQLDQQIIHFTSGYMHVWYLSGATNQFEVVTTGFGMLKICDKYRLVSTSESCRQMSMRERLESEIKQRQDMELQQHHRMKEIQKRCAKAQAD